MELLVELGGGLRSDDFMFEPGCGEGGFLDIASQLGVRCIGVEKNSQRAEIARSRGHHVLTGDFCTVPLPMELTIALGNPPYTTSIIDQLLNRLADPVAFPVLERINLLIPIFYLSNSKHVQAIREHFSINAHIIPRNTFGRIRHPLAFARFDRNAKRQLVGLALYDQTEDVLNMAVRVQRGLQTRQTWKTVVREALEALGGSGTLKQLYAIAEPKRPSPNIWWRDKIRQVAPMVSRQKIDGVFFL